MPLSTLHLVIARETAQRAGYPLSGRLLLGSLAPDGVRTRPGAEVLDYNRVHFRVPDWKAAAQAGAQIMRDNWDNPYLAGCGIHILSEALWLTGPRRRFLAGLTEAQEEERSRLYGHDIEVMERTLFREVDVRELWNAALAARPCDMGEFVTASEVDTWRKDRYAVLSQAARTDSTQILSMNDVWDFIRETSVTAANELLRGKPGKETK